ncbi:hypothetical protein BH18ACT3_BH18ACT3_24620 [soil metagenome]
MLVWASNGLGYGFLDVLGGDGEVVDGLAEGGDV